MYVRKQNDLQPAPIDQALKTVSDRLTQIAADGGIIAGVLSPFLTVEEAYLMASYIKGLNPPRTCWPLGPVPTEGQDRTFTPDQFNGRTGDTSFVVPRPFTIHAEKCPNRKGVEAILEHFQGEVLSWGDFEGRAHLGDFQAAYIAADAIDPWIDEQRAQAVRSKVEFLVVQDTTVTPLAQKADVVLAGATFAEKAGSYVNSNGRLQYAEASLPPRDGSLPDLDLFAILLHRAGGPIRSREILAELAEAVPAFGVATKGRVPEFGVTIGDPALASVAAFPFSDPWTVPRYERADRPG